MNIALIFPGQGSQKAGMGLEFFQSSPQAKAIFDKADEICPDLSKVIFEGPEEKLTSTAYCQPAIFTMSVAALEAFKAHPKFKDYSIKFTAGHSLGEYCALYAAGVMPFEEALHLVQKRAAYMEEATQKYEGSMTAVLGNVNLNRLQDICNQTSVQIANFNSKEQIVISGSTIDIQAANNLIDAEGWKKVPLVVSGAFHSPLMSWASSKFEKLLKGVHFQSPIVPVLSNVTGQPHKESELPTNLASQIDSSVQWVKCVEYMASHGITHFIEIGPGKVLKGLIRRINPALNVMNIEKPSDIN